MDNFIIHTFQPIFNKDSKILILGTIPSPKSREYGFYYSHPQNRLWRVISELMSQKVPITNDEKKTFLYENKIAMWDVLKSCIINGADDNSIKNPTANDFSEILSTANISAIFTTGKKATVLYKKYCLCFTHIESLYLPSTSPANCRYSYCNLIDEYRIILKYLSDTINVQLP